MILMLMSVNSINQAPHGERQCCCVPPGPSTMPVTRGHTCLVDRNCWLYWLRYREDELIHHTITCSKIFNSKMDNLFKMIISMLAGCGLTTGHSGLVSRGLKWYHLLGGELGCIHHYATPLLGLWLTKIITGIHKDNYNNVLHYLCYNR